jgi:nucleotide-binding universal stress UspA family protein
VSGVVIGMKRNRDCTAAVRWGFNEAAMRGLTVQLVHAWDEPLDVSVNLGPDSLPELNSGATCCAMQGAAADVLLARQPDVLVLGGHTGGRHISHLTRSCLHGMPCPVVIVPTAQRPYSGRVLVGVPGNQASPTALLWAAQEARNRRATLVVVQAWQLHPASVRDVLQPARTMPAQQAAALDRLREWVHATLGDVDAELHATHGGPLDALLPLSADADLLVLGRGTHSGVGRLLHGAVGDDVSGLGPCPVAVVPNLATPRSSAGRP